MKIYIIRHGETPANKDGLFQGWTDYPLNENGIKLAEITSTAFKDIKFDVCYTSPLKRARQTAEIMLNGSGNNNTPIIVDERIKEINGGVFENFHLRGEVKPLQAIILLTFIKNPHLLPPFKNGENVRMVEKRSQDFLNELATKNYDNVLVSMHGCSMRAMLNKLYDKPNRFWQGHVPYNCAVNIVEVKDGKMTLLTKDDDKLYYDKNLAVDLFKRADNKAQFK